MYEDLTEAASLGTTNEAPRHLWSGEWELEPAAAEDLAQKASRRLTTATRSVSSPPSPSPCKPHASLYQPQAVQRGTNQLLGTGLVVTEANPQSDA